MKVSGGLVGITLNPNVRTKYFLIAPELARVAEQATQMAVSSSTTPKHHHTLATAVRLLQEKNIEQLTITIRGFTNPFLEESSDLFNLATKVVMSKEVKRDMCQQSAIGKELYGNFLKERIPSSKYSIWSPITKRKLFAWESTGKTLRVVSKDKLVELKEDCSLFAWMMMVCKARAEVGIKEAVGRMSFQ